MSVNAHAALLSQFAKAGELVGVTASALAIGGVLVLLHRAWGFGSDAISAPQATLMKVIVEGIMDGGLPWGLLATGAAIAAVLAILRIPVMPVAEGWRFDQRGFMVKYAPWHLRACILCRASTPGSERRW